jgi:hypothetical protein
VPCESTASYRRGSVFRSSSVHVAYLVGKVALGRGFFFFLFTSVFPLSVSSENTLHSHLYPTLHDLNQYLSSIKKKNRVFSADVCLWPRPLCYMTAGWTNLNFLLLSTVLWGVVIHCARTRCKQLFVYAYFLECDFERGTSAWNLLPTRDLEDCSDGSHGEYKNYMRLYSVSFITTAASWCRIYDVGRIFLFFPILVLWPQWVSEISSCDGVWSLGIDAK